MTAIEAQWSVAMSVWRAAFEALTTHEAVRALPDHPEIERLENEQRALAKIEGDALRAFLAARAPTAAALLEKMAIVEAEYGRNDYLGELMADVRHLCGEA